MTFALTSEQRSEIQALRDAMGQHNTNLGAAGALYDAIYAAITVNGSAAPDITPEVWTWIAGAKNVNAGIGSFAQLIRDNTARQWEIRYGTQMPQAELDKASNNIAYAVATDFLDQTRTSAPTLAEIGARDAGAVASGVFGSDLHSSEPLGNWAAWAGTILFVNLGYSNFFRDYLLNGSTAGREDTKSQIGTYDLVAANQAIQDFQTSLSSASQGFWENLWTAGSLWWNYGSNLAAAETEGDAWLKAQYGLDARHAVTAGSDLLGPFSTATNIAKSATWHAGTYGNDTLTSALSGGRDVLNAGKGNDTISGGSGSDIVDGGEDIDSLSYASTSLAYRYQVTINGNRTWQDASPYRLEIEKIPALVSGPSAWDLAFNVERMTLGQYADIVKFNGANIGGTLTVDGGPGTAIDTLDLSAMTRALSGADFDGTTITIGGATFSGFEKLIGTSKADTISLAGAGPFRINGGAENDHLSGGSGNDQLIGGSGLDTIVGGAGADEIYDEDAVILDYSASTAAVSFTYFANGDKLVGTGGDAQGDQIFLGTTYGIGGRTFVDMTITGTIYGDTLRARQGWDRATLTGGDGNDFLYGSYGNDNLSGGEHRDFISPGGGWDVVNFGEGGGTLSYQDVYGVTVNHVMGSGVAQIFNSAGAQTGATVISGSYESIWANGTITGDDQNNVIDSIGTVRGGGGKDIIRGSGVIHGDAGDDTITIGNGTAFGGDDNDVITALPGGNDWVTIYGGAGINRMVATSQFSGRVNLMGGEGIDEFVSNGYASVYYQASTIGVVIQGSVGTGGDAAGDTLTGINRLVGSGVRDIFVNANVTQLYAGAGNDEITNSFSYRQVYGEAGNDTIIGSGNGGIDDDTFIGTSFGDIMVGGQGFDSFRGWGGNDTITLDGAEADLVVYGKGDGHDFLNQFTPGNDKIAFVREVGYQDPEFSWWNDGGNTKVEVIWRLPAPESGPPPTLQPHQYGGMTLYGTSASQVSASDFVFV